MKKTKKGTKKQKQKNTPKQMSNPIKVMVSLVHYRKSKADIR